MDIESQQLAARAVAVGLGATALMDLWLLALRRAGLPGMDFALLGRWVGHALKGRFAHAAIGRATPLAGERALGWLAHYAVGIAFALALVGIQGLDWLLRPALLPALAWGLATVAAPLCVLQPAMGAGLASSRTAAPLRAVARSLLNHAVFGVGLYLSAAAWAALASPAT